MWEANRTIRYIPLGVVPLIVTLLTHQLALSVCELLEFGHWLESFQLGQKNDADEPLAMFILLASKSCAADPSLSKSHNHLTFCNTRVSRIGVP